MRLCWELQVPGYRPHTSGEKRAQGGSLCVEQRIMQATEGQEWTELGGTLSADHGQAPRKESWQVSSSGPLLS